MLRIVLRVHVAGKYTTTHCCGVNLARIVLAGSMGDWR